MTHLWAAVSDGRHGRCRRFGAAAAVAFPPNRDSCALRTGAEPSSRLLRLYWSTSFDVLPRSALYTRARRVVVMNAHPQDSRCGSAPARVEGGSGTAWGCPPR